MNKISDVLDRIEDINRLESLVDDLQKTGVTTVSFCYGRKFSLPNYSNALSLKDLLVKIDKLYQKISQEGEHHHTVQRISKKISHLNDQAEAKLNVAHFFIYWMTRAKRFFVGIKFKNLEVLKALTDTSMKELLAASKFHGTVFSTLFIMSKMPGDDKHAVVHYGKLQALKIPCFAGECSRGISGVNLRGSSWSASIHTSISYATYEFSLFSGGSRFTIERSREILRRLINDVSVYERTKKSYDLYNPDPDDLSAWNRYELSIRRLRFLDDGAFQKEYSEKLKKWVESSIALCTERSQNLEELPQNKKRNLDTIPLLKEFEKVISEPLENHLIKNEQDCQGITDMTPVIFGSFSVSQKEQLGKSDEYCVERSMKLGREIQYMMTDTDASVEKIRSYLNREGLGEKISVFKFKKASMRLSLDEPMAS
jgi:hypothetical protein